MSKSPFPIDQALTAIVVAYKNANYIADMVAPRVRVNKQEFKYSKYSDDKFFNVPDTLVGRRSRPNELTLDASESVSATRDYALDNPIPMADVENSDERFDPIGDGAALLAESIALDREQRVATKVFASGSYNALLRATLAGASQWSDITSTPIPVINDALDQPLMRPNTLVFGQAGWTKFRSHPQIVEAVLGTAAKQGNVTRQAVAELFEVDEVIVGGARANSAKPGQTPSLVRLWGKHMAMIYRSPVQTKDTADFIKTFQFGDKVAGQWEDKDIGMRGGIRVRTGESVVEEIVASQAGYFFQNIVA
jgi:hypothetical protein